MLTIHARSWIRRSQATRSATAVTPPIASAAAAGRQQLHVLADRRLPQDRERDERDRHAVRRRRQPLPGGIEPVDRHEPGDGIQDAERRAAAARQRAGIRQRAEHVGAAEDEARAPDQREHGHQRDVGGRVDEGVRRPAAGGAVASAAAAADSVGLRLQLGEPPLERGDRARQIRHLPLERREAIVHRISNGGCVWGGCSAHFTPDAPGTQEGRRSQRRFMDDWISSSDTPSTARATASRSCSRAGEVHRAVDVRAAGARRQRGGGRRRLELVERAERLGARATAGRRCSCWPRRRRTARPAASTAS